MHGMMRISRYDLFLCIKLREKAKKKEKKSIIHLIKVGASTSFSLSTDLLKQLNSLLRYINVYFDFFKDISYFNPILLKFLIF